MLAYFRELCYSLACALERFGDAALRAMTAIHRWLRPAPYRELDAIWNRCTGLQFDLMEKASLIRWYEREQKSADILLCAFQATLKAATDEGDKDSGGRTMHRVTLLPMEIRGMLACMDGDLDEVRRCQIDVEQYRKEETEAMRLTREIEAHEASTRQIAAAGYPGEALGEKPFLTDSGPVRLDEMPHGC